MKLNWIESITAWNRMMVKIPKALVAQPGIGRSVARRTNTMTTRPTIVRTIRPSVATRSRTPMMSPKTEMALRPWATSRTKFIPERAREPPGPPGRQRVERLLRLHDRRGIMVPELRDDDQAVEAAPGITLKFPTRTPMPTRTQCNIL